MVPQLLYRYVKYKHIKDSTVSQQYSITSIKSCPSLIALPHSLNTIFRSILPSESASMVSDYGGAQPAGFPGSELCRRPAARGVPNQHEPLAVRGREFDRQPQNFRGAELGRQPATRGVLNQRELPAVRGPEMIRATRDLQGSELRRQPQGSWAVPLKHQPSLSQGSELVRNAKGPRGPQPAYHPTKARGSDLGQQSNVHESSTIGAFSEASLGRHDYHLGVPSQVASGDTVMGPYKYGRSPPISWRHKGVPGHGQKKETGFIDEKPLEYENSPMKASCVRAKPQYDLEYMRKEQSEYVEPPAKPIFAPAKPKHVPAYVSSQGLAAQGGQNSHNSGYGNFRSETLRTAGLFQASVTLGPTDTQGSQSTPAQLEDMSEGWRRPNNIPEKQYHHVSPVTSV